MGKKIQALLAVLGVRPGQTYTRDRLGALFWGESADDQARHSVRQALFAVRRALPESLLRTSGDLVSLDRDSVSVDVEEFERLAATPTPEAAEQAGRLYRGDFVEGLKLREAAFEEWVALERDRLRAMAIGALDRLTHSLMESGALEPALESAHRMVGLDPMREPSHRTLMHLYHRTGRRAAALRQYQTLERMLDRELGVTPDAETTALFNKILEAGPSPMGELANRPTRACILVVEDEPVTRAVIEGFLTVAGHDVTTVSDGADAVVQLGTRRFDLILTDIATPAVDGLALVEVVARKGLQTPVVFVTGQPGDELEVKGLGLGAADYIRKPIHRDVLLLRVQRALRVR